MAFDNYHRSPCTISYACRYCDCVMRVTSIVHNALNLCLSISELRLLCFECVKCNISVCGHDCVYFYNVCQDLL